MVEKANIGQENKNCLICKKEVNDLLFCEECREKDVNTRITAFANSKYWGNNE